MTKRLIISLAFTAAVASITISFASAQGRGGAPQQPAVTGPWSDKTKSADERAELLLKEMTLDEKITLVHGGGRGFGAQQTAAPAGPAVSNGGAGFTQSVPRLGIPAIQMADASVGVTRGAAASRYSTWLPDTVSAASTWDVTLACE